MPGSRIPGFFQLSAQERATQVQRFASLSAAELAELLDERGLELDVAEHMVENVIGVYALPLAIGTNLLVNGRDYLLPMVIEEPSVVAGFSFGARLLREGGGLTAESDPPCMIGQMQVLDMADLAAARSRLLAAREELLMRADALHPNTVARGGGAREIEVRLFTSSAVGPMLVVHLIYDVRDAMGANAINTIVEALAPLVGEITGGRVALRILSNLADRRLARAWGRVPQQALAMEGLTAEQGVTRILEADALAAVDPYRAATHNKGIMNAIDAIALATGNDWRAIEAGAHAYAAREGAYRPLSRWERDASGDLIGTIELPITAGTVGGATQVHPKARLALKVLGVQSAPELAGVMAAAGLAQNLAALRALAMEGIQRGHMALHARQVALAAGAPQGLVETIAARMVAEGAVRLERAQAILAELRS